MDEVYGRLDCRHEADDGACGRAPDPAVDRGTRIAMRAYETDHSFEATICLTGAAITS